MDLTEHYNKLYRDSLEKIISDDYQIDKLIDSSFDKRLGITLLVRPDVQTKNKIQKFLNELKEIESGQYYYPDSDIHITVMAIISCYEEFDPKDISIPKYIELIKKSINSRESINIQFKGITASPSCIMIQGFPDNEGVNDIRNDLRINFKNSNLQQSIDSRYSIQTAHSTVVRFRENFTRKQEYIAVLEKYRNYNFGSFKVDRLELVCNDWYQREEYVNKLYEFKIPSSG